MRTNQHNTPFKTMSHILDTIENESFTCVITEEDDGRIHFIADADIDADSANGQHSGPPTYTDDDSGSEWLANGGIAIVNDLRSQALLAPQSSQS
jgi:hypothetical protein